MRRCTPRSLVEQPVRVAALDRERRRAEPGLGARASTSSTSTSKPRRSAQRVNMRSSMWVQSCASVPPAPEWTSQMASRSSCSPVNSARSSSVVELVGRGRRCPASISASSDSSPSSRASWCERLEVGDRAVEPVDELDVVAQRGRARVVSSRARSGSSQRSGFGRLGLAARRARSRAVVDLQVRARVLDAAAKLGEVVGEVAHGEAADGVGGRSAAVAELVLLAAAAVARLVAARASSRPAPAPSARSGRSGRAPRAAGPPASSGRRAPRAASAAARGRAAHRRPAPGPRRAVAHAAGRRRAGRVLG